MVQRHGGSWHRGAPSDPTTPVRGKGHRSDEHESSRPAQPSSSSGSTAKKNQTMQSFVDSFLSPFVQCVTPPLQTCVAPTSTPWQPGNRHRSPRESSDVVMTAAPSPPSYWTHQFGENDVLCGKGRSSICHPGNKRFREIVDANRSVYATATKKHKFFLAHSIVDLVRRANPPGRFLLRDAESGRWYDIGRNRSLEKTSQALRDKPPATNSDTTSSSPTIAAAPSPKSHCRVRPSLVIPQHLQHIYQAPLATEVRNPPHTEDGHYHHHHATAAGMYLYPIPSVSSFEYVSPCNSGLSDGIMQAASPGGANHHHHHSLQTGPPSVMATTLPMHPAQPQHALEHRVPQVASHRRAVSPPAARSPVYYSPHRSARVDKPPLATASSSGSSEAFAPPQLSQDVFRPTTCTAATTTTTATWKSPTVFSTTPVDGYREMVAPSSVRRGRRHESGEDGQAALAAAAFLNLDDIE